MAKAHAIPTYTDDSAMPYMMLVVGILVGASAPICVRLAQGEGVPTLMIAFTRLALSSLFLMPFALRRYQREIANLSRADLFYTAIAGLMLAAHFILLFIAFENTSILIAGVIAGSSPLWVALMEVFFLKTRLSRLVWFGLFLAIGGGVIIGLSGANGTIIMGQNPVLGSVLALISAVLAAVYLIAGRKVRTHMPLLLFIWLVFSFGAVVTLVALVATSTPIIGYSLEGYFWLLVLTLGAQLIAQSAFNYSLAFLSATFISIAGQAVTVVASIGAFLVFAEVPRELQIVGSIVLVIGVVMTSLGQTRPIPNPDVALPESPGK